MADIVLYKPRRFSAYHILAGANITVSQVDNNITISGTGGGGGGTVMPTVVTGTSSNLINWATGVTPSSFGQFVNTGWTSADNTYAGGFNSSFSIVYDGTAVMPYLGIKIP